MLNELFAREEFVVNAITKTNKTTGRRHAAVYILFKENASQVDMVRAYVLSFVIRSLLWKEGFCEKKTVSTYLRNTLWKSSDIRSNTGHVREQRADVLTQALELGKEGIFSDLIHKLLSDKDWRVSGTMIETRFARITETNK